MRPYFKCGQCREKFKYELIKMHDKSYAPVGDQVEYKCAKRGCNKMSTTKGGL